MKQLLYILAATLFATGCKKDDTKIFEETPEERMSARIDELNSALNSSQYGWKASLTTSAKGGYGFYMDFKSPGSITMVADLDSATATQANTSTYRIKWVMNATLIFDTYNYISLLQDPNPATYGGNAGSGLQSDVEFEYERINGDSVLLRGFKYKNELVLVKVTAEQKDRYLSAAYKANIDAINNYFVGKTYNFINIAGLNNKVQFLFDKGNKTVVFQYTDNNGEVKKADGKFNFEDVGLIFSSGGITVNGITFVSAGMENGYFVLYDDHGNKYVVHQSSVPILLMQNLFAYNGLYRELYIPPNPPTGINSGFNNVYFACQALFGQMNPKRQLIDVRFVLASSNTATLITHNGSNAPTFEAIATYPYTYVNGMLTLSNASYDGNWAQRSKEYKPLQDYFANAVFKVDYVTTNNPLLPLVGGLYKDNSSFFYGALR
ncbi:hypothetical protein A4H97_11675 [Niastella yeongjuensis]|uniref:DUF4302 domain-containing protein n=1 Tax=Niastella yeongjuensis TaxID=354355 RepID=A0A1V9E9L7_9BACT|nr:DUF4302 domain-containing protein [Niastella yeongjuensis]OQP42813.1 hypothetical protein A4H97_11675 [Niastella yeongjuensis]SEO55147.1 protein of unknown function [Niastella yeongjuensis]